MGHWSHIWHHKISVSNNTKLQRLNRLACLNIAPVHKSTPSKGLEICYNLPPLDLVLNRIGAHNHLRIKDQVSKHWDGIGHKHKGHMLKNEAKCSSMCVNDITLDRLNAKLIWDRNFTVLEFEKHKNDSHENDNTVYCYTDGSKINHQVGLGYVIKHNSLNLMEKYEHLGKHATVFQAEVLAILRASEAVEELNIIKNAKNKSLKE